MEYHIKYDEMRRCYVLYKWDNIGTKEIPYTIKTWSKQEFNQLIELILER